MTTQSDARPALTILTEEEEMFRDAVAGFVAEEVRPRVMEMERRADLQRSHPQVFRAGTDGIES